LKSILDSGFYSIVKKYSEALVCFVQRFSLCWCWVCETIEVHTAFKSWLKPSNAWQRIYSNFKPVVVQNSLAEVWCCDVVVNNEEGTCCSGIKTLNAKSMKPSQLIRHSETKHPNPEPSPESFEGGECICSGDLTFWNLIKTPPINTASYFNLVG